MTALISLLAGRVCVARAFTPDGRPVASTATCRGLVGNFLDMPLEAMQFYARLGVLPHHVWVTAHARGVPLENCPVAAGRMEAVPSQREKKSTERRPRPTAAVGSGGGEEGAKA